jgi:hypothetical protein
MALKHRPQTIRLFVDAFDFARAQGPIKHHQLVRQTGRGVLRLAAFRRAVKGFVAARMVGIQPAKGSKYRQRNSGVLKVDALRDQRFFRVGFLEQAPHFLEPMPSIPVPLRGRQVACQKFLDALKLFRCVGK